MDTSSYPALSIGSSLGRRHPPGRLGQRLPSKRITGFLLSRAVRVGKHDTHASNRQLFFNKGINFGWKADNHYVVWRQSTRRHETLLCSEVIVLFNSPQKIRDGDGRKRCDKARQRRSRAAECVLPSRSQVLTTTCLRYVSLSTAAASTFVLPVIRSARKHPGHLHHRTNQALDTTCFPGSFSRRYTFR